MEVTMPTERLYRVNVYKKGTSAEVTETREIDGMDAVVCDRTVFFPTGGGQPCDTGRIGDHNVTDVFDESLEGDVFHVTDAPYGTFHSGDTVTMELDWERRFTHMQRHLGEHILSGVFQELYGGGNKGFHMGEDFMTIDIDTDGRPLTAEMLEAAEQRANEIIQQDVPVSVTYFEDAEAASSMPVRKPVTAKGRISIVTVGDVSKPYDCCACCGTHPSTSGQVGLVRIYRSEPNKGMTRIFFDAGMPALKQSRSDMLLLHSVMDRYHAGRDDITHKLNVMDRKSSDLRAQIATLSNMVKDHELELMPTSDIPEVYTRRIDSVDPGELVKLGFSMVERSVAGDRADGLIILVHEPSETVLLFSSGTPDCGTLVREHAFAHGGRGGGRKDNARAVFSKRHDLNTFVQDITETEIK